MTSRRRAKKKSEKENEDCAFGFKPLTANTTGSYLGGTGTLQANATGEYWAYGDDSGLHASHPPQTPPDPEK